MIFPLGCFQAFPDALPFVCPVMFQLPPFLELSLQLCNTEGSFDTVTNGLQPLNLPAVNKLLVHAFGSNAIATFVAMTQGFLHCGLSPEIFSCLAEVQTFLVFLVGTLASAAGFSEHLRHHVLERSSGSRRASKTIRNGLLGGVDPDDVQVAEVDALLVQQRRAGAAPGAAVQGGGGRSSGTHLSSGGC